MKRLKDGGIIMNGQIVLCKGWNDGEELEKTIHDLSAYLPELQSVSVVPVGLTKFRKGLEELTPYSKEESLDVLNVIHRWQNIFLTHYQTRFIYASDEWYIKAGLPIPDSDSYEGYPQIENGVGLIRSLQDEFDEYYEELTGDDRARNVSIATGVLASPYIRQLCDKLKNKFPYVNVTVHTIINDYFGHDITVAGLITGGDLINQLKEKSLGDSLLIPDVMLRNGRPYYWMMLP
jgi:putative radical SAM enzyme (TIGR03279 family)